MTQNSQDKKGIKIDFNLTQRQRVILASILTVVTIIVIGSGIILYYNSKTKPNTEDSNNDELTAAVNNLGSNLSNISPQDLFYKDVTFEDLDIYPSGWVQRNFTSSEQANELISGPTGDPDKDGLSNKLEFIYGSNPKKADSLCDGQKNGAQCVGRTDKENVDANISPLTGLSLSEDAKTFSINFQNKAVIESLKESFDNASKDGLDFPTLYQLSKTVDYTNDLKLITPKTEPETRQNQLDYTQFQIDLVNGILGSNELQSLSKIYSLVNASDLQNQKTALEAKLKDIENYTAPETLSESHKLYIYIFQDLVKLVSLRLDAVTNNSIESDTYRADAKKTAVSITWAYRKLNEKNLVVK